MCPVTPPKSTPATQDRRQKRLEERDSRILDAAREHLLRDGYHGLSMEALAESIHYSRATVYQHYRSKEDVLVALAAQTGEKRVELFERASAFRGRPRERMVAIGEAVAHFTLKYPSHFKTEQIIHSSSVRSKCSPENQVRLSTCEARCPQITAGIVRDAVSQGDLLLPKAVSPEQLVFGLWSMYFGALFLMSSDIELESKGGIPDPMTALRRASASLLDGYGWKPLSSKWDYEATRKRIAQEVLREGR
jgi:AcrR family transcriptional regulator